MFKIINVFFLFSVSLFSNSHTELYWNHVKDNKWHKVPTGEGSTNIDLSYSKRAESLYKDADFVGILYPVKYQKFECDSESSECGRYKAKVVTTFKGIKKKGSLVFVDDLTNAPDVYQKNAIYILYKENNIYYQDEFIQIEPSKKWIEIFKKISLKYKSHIKLFLSEIKKNPNRTVAYYNLGDAYWELGEKDKAIKAYTTYIEQMRNKGLQKKIPKEVLKRVEVK